MLHCAIAAATAGELAIVMQPLRLQRIRLEHERGRGYCDFC